MEKKAAACVSVSSPVSSYYRWQGRIENEQEIVLLIKTLKNNYSLVEKLILENHSYELPEILALPVELADRDYFKWLSENCLFQEEE